MKKLSSRQNSVLASFLLLISLEGCFDFQEARVAGEKGVNIAPVIEKKYVSPPPSSFLKPIPFSANCKEIEFKIPPIRDFNKDDNLYYLWFFDGILLPPFQNIIEPENRDRAIITLKLDRQKVEDAVGRSPLALSFFESSHLIEFVVSDRPYAIAGSRFSDDPQALEDSTHWAVWFTDAPCSQ